MSGGIGPSGDIALPSEDKRNRSSTFRQLNARRGEPRGPGLLPRLYVLHLQNRLPPGSYLRACSREGDKEWIKAAAPHVFLLASQVFVEESSGGRQHGVLLPVYLPKAFRIYCQSSHTKPN